MTLKAKWCKHTLNFKFLAGTSRGTLKTKDSYFIKIWDTNTPEIFGLGEVSPLSWLSPEYQSIQEEIERIVHHINKRGSLENHYVENCSSSLRFGLETAIAGLENKDFSHIYGANFKDSGNEILINGLIWMGSEAFMREQIEMKLQAGFDTLKMKIGAIDYATEIQILRDIRKAHPKNDLTIRVDANGAFSPSEALKVLNDLAELEIHSIEQPIETKQWDQMATLCASTPLPIALDEELIGLDDRSRVLDHIQPQYIILKPSLHGGLQGSADWITEAKSRNIDYWMTSALESNIGLNAICQFAAEQGITIPQGLGTGQLYHNNIDSPLLIENGKIRYDKNLSWNLDPINSLFE